jgi:hypothetical protein
VFRPERNAAAGTHRPPRFDEIARPGKLFTAGRDLITSEVAVLRPEALKRVVDAVVDRLRSGTSAPSLPAI